MPFAQKNYLQPQGIPPTNYKKVSVGHRSGKLEIVNYSHSDKQNHFWVCRCDCGNSVVVRARLLKGHTNSCGCLRLENVTRHGLSASSTASIWRNMKYRCGNPNAANYKIYGGRGIKVCDRWQKFENFYEDMGKRPSKEYSLDRIDVDGDYEPSNCRWATKKGQSRNRRDNRLLTHKGITKTVIEFCEEYGLKHHQLLSRLNNGWSINRALNTPIRERH